MRGADHTHSWEVDVDAVVAGWQSTVAQLQKEAANDDNTTRDLQITGGPPHIPRITQ